MKICLVVLGAVSCILWLPRAMGNIAADETETLALQPPVAKHVEEDQEEVVPVRVVTNKRRNRRQRQRRRRDQVRLSTTPHVNNGKRADVNEYNFFAQMWWNGNSQGCGGGLVATRFIITAAHCVQNAGHLMATQGYPSWRIGSYCLFAGNCGSRVEVINSKKGHIHPKYDNVKTIWDLALIELEHDVTVPGINPVDIDVAGRFSENLQRGELIRGIGMGRTDNDSLPDYLQEVDNHFLPLSDCRSYYTTGSVFDESVMCTNGLNFGMCQGDSGSPVLKAVPTKPSGFVQISVTSFGPPRCAGHNHPDGSARIGAAEHWVKGIICGYYKSEERTDGPTWCYPPHVDGHMHDYGDLHGNDKPTSDPTYSPTKEPTRDPTREPTRDPTRNPIEKPTKSPVEGPPAGSNSASERSVGAGASTNKENNGKGSCFNMGTFYDFKKEEKMHCYAINDAETQTRYCESLRSNAKERCPKRCGLCGIRFTEFED